jgi:hypothetical protein
MHEFEEAEHKEDLRLLGFNERHTQALWKAIEKCQRQKANVGTVVRERYDYL